jgi:hypothetical protein
MDILSPYFAGGLAQLGFEVAEGGLSPKIG